MKHEGVFCLKLSDVGTFRCRGSYKRFENNNALKLLFQMVRTASYDIAGEERTAMLEFALAVMILRNINYTDEHLNKQLKQSKEEFEKEVFSLFEATEQSIKEMRE